VALRSLWPELLPEWLIENITTNKKPSKKSLVVLKYLQGAVDLALDKKRSSVNMLSFGMAKKQ
tara:strand:- start:249 stop:437 length:189 start_codon:yes stop_codon:yes gene_type:complete